MYISEKVAASYDEAREWAEMEGVSGYAISGTAYLSAKRLAEQEGGKANYLDSPNEGDYPTIIYTFSDGSGCRLSYGGCYSH